MPHAQLTDVRLYYEEHGRGAPLVLVPGFGMGHWIWFKQVSDFAQKFRTIVFDPRGVGGSEQRDEPLSIRTLADDLAALLDKLSIDGAHIVGSSFGGFVAQEFALAHASKARSLVLCCTSFGGPRHCPPAPETLAAIASTKGLHTEERVRENLRIAFSDSFVAERSEVIERLVDASGETCVPEFVYQRQLQAALNFDASERVAQIRTPTLVVTGDADRIVPFENSHNLAARIPGARLHIVEGGSHTFFIERAGEFNRAVVEFIESIG